MRCKELIAQIETAYPTSYAESWDNVGLLVGSRNKEIQTVYIALDATKEVINHAAFANADLLLTHHPMIFSPIKNVTDDEFVGSRIIDLLKQDVAYYAMHTNYDVLRMGQLAAEMLKLQDIKMLEVTAEDGNGIGKIGEWQETLTVEACANLVKETFLQQTVKIYGEREKPISKVAVVPGSGGDFIKQALAAGVELLITGDIDYHEGIDAVARGLSIIDAGHYGVEHIFIEDMKQWICSQIKGIRVITEKITQPCYFC